MIEGCISVVHGVDHITVVSRVMSVYDIQSEDKLKDSLLQSTQVSLIKSRAL